MENMMQRILPALLAVALAVPSFAQVTITPPLGGGGGTTLPFATDGDLTNDDILVCLGTGSDTCMEWAESFTKPSLAIWLETTSKALIIADLADQATDIGLNDFANPTIRMWSNDVTGTDYMDIYHDTNGGFINAVGGLSLLSTGTVALGNTEAGAGSTWYSESTYCWTVEGTANALELTLCATNPTADNDLTYGDKIDGFFMVDSLEVVTTTKTPLMAESNETYTSTGDADGSAITLPNDPVVGTVFHFSVNEAQTVTITPNTNELLFLAAANCAVSISSATVGSTITLRAVEGGDTGEWYSFGASGTWACNS